MTKLLKNLERIFMSGEPNKAKIIEAVDIILFL